MHYLPGTEGFVESFVRSCHHPEKTSISLTETTNNAKTDMFVYVSVLPDKLWPSVDSVQPLKPPEIFISRWPIPVTNSCRKNAKWISIAHNVKCYCILFLLLGIWQGLHVCWRDLFFKIKVSYVHLVKLSVKHKIYCLFLIETKMLFTPVPLLSVKKHIFFCG